MDMFSDLEKEKITLVLTYVKKCGDYARRFHSGEVSENKLDVKMCIRDRGCTELWRWN